MTLGDASNAPSALAAANKPGAKYGSGSAAKGGLPTISEQAGKGPEQLQRLAKGGPVAASGHAKALTQPFR